MRVPTWCALALAGSLALGAGWSRLGADLYPNQKCVVVDNTACQAQSRQYCGVAVETCIRCPGQPSRTCQVMEEYDCLDGVAMTCPGKETGHCVPDPSNPTNKICAGWTSNGVCDPTLTCQ